MCIIPSLLTDKKTVLQIDEYRGITHSQNEHIYELFISKLKNKIYSKRPANPVEKLVNAKEKYINKEIS